MKKTAHNTYLSDAWRTIQTIGTKIVQAKPNRNEIEWIRIENISLFSYLRDTIVQFKRILYARFEFDFLLNVFFLVSLPMSSFQISKQT